VFTGEYRHSVDDKGRLAVPARFRSQLEGGAVVCKWLDNCLAVLTRHGWEELAAKTATLPLTNPGSRAFQRHIFGGAAEVDLDRQGRVVLPAYLRDYAALDGEVGPEPLGRRPAEPRGPGDARRPPRRPRDLGHYMRFQGPLGIR